MSLRQTGRTTAMLEKAKSLALLGKPVLIITRYLRDEHWMNDLVDVKELDVTFMSICQLDFRKELLWRYKPPKIFVDHAARDIMTYQQSLILERRGVL